MRSTKRLPATNRQGQFLLNDQLYQDLKAALRGYAEASKDKRAELTLQVVSEEFRVNVIKERRKDVFDFDVEVTNPSYDLDLCLIYDLEKMLAYISVTGRFYKPRYFEGPLLTVEAILDFVAPMLELDVGEGDKVLLHTNDENVFFPSEADAFEGFGDPYGFHPDSPEFCSDDEREAFFPNSG